MAHLVLTLLAVSATGNHWWLDGIAAIGLLVLALRIDTFVRHRWRALEARRSGAHASFVLEEQAIVSGV